MSLSKILVPEQKRGFKGKRWLGIILRTMHLVGLLGVGAGVLFSVEESAWMPYLWFTMATGGVMMLIEFWTSAVWAVQFRGLATITKVTLLALIPVSDWDLALMIAIVIISAVFAHAPANVRYYSIYHRRVL
ncbi:MAG: hypothetical protein HUJ30_08610 [Gammaproteobacteria bacterium]|nr:hypothetical protein [Gammaproteobacteria bacterium]